jgi:hypothetical protein
MRGTSLAAASHVASSTHLCRECLDFEAGRRLEAPSSREDNGGWTRQLVRQKRSYVGDAMVRVRSYICYRSG